MEGTAEFAAKYFKKGDLLSVQGRFETRKYTDKNGNNREAVELTADNLYFGESRREAQKPAEKAADENVEFDPFGEELPDFPA